MVTADDVAALVGTQLLATGAFTSAVPGGVSLDRGATEPTGYPYAVIKLSTVEPRLCFDDAYVQAWTARVAAYCPVGQAGVNPQAVETAILAALGTEAASAALMATALRNASERVMHARPMPATAEYDPSLRDGRDVFVAGLTIEILVQGTRSVS